MRAGEKLLMIRDKLGMTQREFARRAGVTASSIYKIEAGTMLGSLRTWIGIQRATGCSIDEMVQDELQ